MNRSRSLCKTCNTLFFYFFSILNTYFPLIFHGKIQPNIPSGSEEEVDFGNIAIFRNGGHLEYLTCPNFTVLRHCSQVMLRVKLENCKSSDFVEEDI